MEVAVIRYQEGELDFNTLIATLTSNVQQQDLLAATKGGVSVNLVQLYRALGGGWEMRERTGYWDGVLK
jgi:outer membrane protein TolC